MQLLCELKTLQKFDILNCIQSILLFFVVAKFAPILFLKIGHILTTITEKYIETTLAIKVFSKLCNFI